MRSSFVLTLLLVGAVGHAPMALAQIAGKFTATGNMTVARSGHTATLLQDGRVLITGGGSATVELYDPSTGTFTATGATTASKYGGSATPLPDGKVMLIEATNVTGVVSALPVTYLYTRYTELYDPSAGTIARSMVDSQPGYTPTLLLNGKVLLTGGASGETNCCSIAAPPELYDPSTPMFSLAGPYADTGAPSISANYGAGSSGLVDAPATLLPDGRVLISSESAAELYDPTGNAFSLTASMIGAPGYTPTAIGGRTATLLLNGKVLVTGGTPVYFDTSGFESFDAAELYDSRAGKFTATGDMTTGRFSHTAALLPDGTVLITGGRFDGRSNEVNTTGELYNPAAGVFFGAGNMVSGRVSHQATLLNDGRVLITGGSKNGQALASAEIYTPPVLVGPPVLLSLSGDGKGQGAILHAGTPQVASSDNRAVLGEALEIYCTGLAAGSVIPPQVAIGGHMAEILFFGKAPAYSDLNQVNVRVPSGVVPGPAVPVRLNYLGRPSNEVTIGVQ
jgi:hypothetical protein